MVLTRPLAVADPSSLAPAEAPVVIAVAAVEAVLAPASATAIVEEAALVPALAAEFVADAVNFSL